MRSIAAFVVLTAMTAFAGTTATAGPAATSTAPGPSVNRMSVIGTVSDQMAAPESTTNNPIRLYTTNGTNPFPYVVVDDNGGRLSPGIASVEPGDTRTRERVAPGIVTAAVMVPAPAIVPASVVVHAPVAVPSAVVAPASVVVPSPVVVHAPAVVPESALVLEPATVTLHTTSGTNPALDAIAEDSGAELNAGIASGELGVTTTARETPGVVATAETSVVPAVVPEPGTVALFGLGLVGWAFVRRSGMRPNRGGRTPISS